MNLVKKLFVYSVVITTVLWSVGVSFAPVADAAGNYPAGSLLALKGQSGAAVYLIGTDGKKYVFPSQKEYSTWYPNFDKVVRVAVSELDLYPDGGAVTVRPGTKLVTHMNTAKVYAIEPGGILRWIPTDTIAKSLYGDNWTSRLVDVIPGFFSSSYKATGADVSTTYPKGTVVKMGSTMYYIDGTTKRAFANDAAFTANGYKTADLVTVTSLTGYTDGTSITGAESAIKDFTPTEGGTVPTFTGSVNVALSSSNPASTTILSDDTANTYPQALIPFMTVNFTAGNDADATVTMVKFVRTGIASDTDLGNLYLYDGNTRLAEYTAFNDKVVTFSNTSGLFSVTKGTTRTITLKGDLARGSTSVGSSKTIGFQMTSSDYVSAGTGSVAGSFPIVGNMMTTAQVTDLGHVSISATTTYPSSVKADEANKELWRFTLTAENQDMQVKYLKYTMVGTIASSDIKNLKLEVGGVQVGSTAQLGSDNTVVFDLASNPISITSGQSKIVVLRGDMNGGSGRVFKFTIQKSSDVVIYDTEYNVYNTLSGTVSNSPFVVVQPTTGNGTSVDAGTLTVGIATDSPVGYIADGASGLTFAKFSFYAAGEAVKIDNLTISCNGTGTNEVLANVKTLLDGSQIGTTDTALTCDNGTDSTTYTYGNTFVVPANTYKYVTVVADTTGANIASGDNLSVSLVAGSGNATGQVTMTSLSSTAQAGRTLGVKTGTVVVAKNSAFGDKSATIPTGTSGAQNVKIASLTITAGAGEAVDVTQIALQDASTVSQMGDNFQNLKLMQGTTQVGATIGNLSTSGSATNYTFTPATAIRVNAGAQVVIDVYADIKSSPADAGTVLSPVVDLDSVTATGVSTSNDASASSQNLSLQNAYIASAGNLTVTADADTTIAQQVVMGATDQEIAKFKFTTDAAEAVTVSQIVISDSVSSAATGSLKNLKLYVDGSQIGQTVQLDTTYATTTYANAVFANLSLVIPADSSKIVTVKADVTPYTEGGTSASTHALAILPDYDGVTASNQEGVTALGNGSGSSITGSLLDFTASPDAGVTTNTMTVYRTKITAAWASDTPSGAATPGTGYLIAKVNVTNSSNVGSYAATIRVMNIGLTESGFNSIAAGTARTLSVYKDNLSTTPLDTTTYGDPYANIDIGNSGFLAADMTDVEIAAGATKTILWTLDTNDAGTTDSLSVNIEAGDIVWYDGVTDSITTVNSLPLTAKTFTY